MKILYFSPHPHINSASPSGPGTHIREVIRGMENAGHEVLPIIAGGTEISPTPFHPQKKGIKETIKSFIPKRVWETVKDRNLRKLSTAQESMLEKIIEEFNPDIIYERCYFMMTAGVRVAKKKGIFHILEVNAPYPQEKIEMSGASLIHQHSLHAEKEQLAKTNMIVVVSSALKDYCINIESSAAHKTLITPNAVNLDTIEKSNPAKDEENSNLIIGFVGSIFPYHGVDNLIRAFAKLTQNDLELLIVGDGEVLDEYKELCHTLNIDKKVTFTGNVPHSEVYNYIQQMDITVMAKSNWYGSPVKIFEYGALGKMIIAPDNVPVNDVMEDGVDGILIDETENELYNSMLQLIENPRKGQVMATNFKHKVIQNHTWNRVAESILDFHSKLSQS